MATKQQLACRWCGAVVALAELSAWGQRSDAGLCDPCRVSCVGPGPNAVVPKPKRAAEPVRLVSRRRPRTRAA
jgi:hypothetical protein